MVNRIIKNSYNINYDLVDVSILENQVNLAFDLMKSCKERKQNKLIFGSVVHWKRFNKGLITKEEFNNIKNKQPVLFIGRNNEP
jgi:hypothetical protein